MGRMSTKRLRQLARSAEFVSSIHPQLTVSQINFLATVKLNPLATQTEIAKKIGLTLSAVSRQVDQFGSKPKRKSDHALGWIEVIHAPNDDRVKLLTMTERGNRFLAQLDAHLYG